MPAAGRLENIDDRRPLTLILRLVIDADGGLVHGEIVSLEGFVHKRFAQWRELVAGLTQLLVDIAHGSISDG